MHIYRYIISLFFVASAFIQVQAQPYKLEVATPAVKADTNKIAQNAS